MSSGLFWIIAAFGTLKISVVWDNGVLLNYTYIPTWEAWVMLFSMGIIGLLMTYIGLLRIPLLGYESIKGVMPK